MITKTEIKLIKNLNSKKFRYLNKMFIVEGKKNVNELLKSNFKIKFLFATQDWIDSKNFKRDIKKVSQLELKKISNQKNPEQVLAVVEFKNQILNNKSSVVVLDQINDPGNFGSIIRTCDWFGVKSIVCSPKSVDMYNPKVIQSSMGSFFRVNIIYEDLTNYLSKVKGKIFGSFLNGNEMKIGSFPKKFHLVMGNESNGISDEIKSLITEKLTIKNIGKKADSLNVASATSILLYEMTA